jgi:CRISPR-associated protein Csb2
MLALGIRYLQGVAVGSHGEHDRVEWPPHPARVFMAMVAAHYQTGADAKERAALLWLEKLPPPDIHTPEALPCSTVTQYVPVNDDRSQFFRDPQTKKIKFYQEIPGIPLHRNRQDRTFARASLASDTVVLRWPSAELSADDLAALGALCPKVTRIGHSSSLVQMWLADSVPDGLQHWRVEEARATHLLRVSCEGTLEELDSSFNGEAVARFCELKVKEAEAGARAEAAERAAKAAAANDAGKAALKVARKAAKEAKAAAKALSVKLPTPFRTVSHCSIARAFPLTRATSLPAKRLPMSRQKGAFLARILSSSRWSEETARIGISTLPARLRSPTAGAKPLPNMLLNSPSSLKP